MPATVPTMKTWADDERVRTADLNSQIRDAVGFVLNPPHTVVYRTTSTNLPSSSVGVVNPWEAALIDTNAGWSAAAPTRVYLNTAGRYLIDAKYQWGNYSGGLRTAFIKMNAGGNQAAGVSLETDTITPTAGAASQIRLQTVRPFVAGDYLELFMWQNSTLTQPTTTGVVGGYLSARWVAP